MGSRNIEEVNPHIHFALYVPGNKKRDFERKASWQLRYLTGKGHYPELPELSELVTVRARLIRVRKDDHREQLPQYALKSLRDEEDVFFGDLNLTDFPPCGFQPDEFPKKPLKTAKRYNVFEAWEVLGQSKQRRSRPSY